MYPLVFIMSLFTGVIVYLWYDYLKKKSIAKLNVILERLAQGDIPSGPIRAKKGDYFEITTNIKKLIANLKGVVKFSEEISGGNFDVGYTPLGKKDRFGHALAQMLKRLQEVSEQDKMHRWATEGLTYFAEVFRLSDNDDLKALSQKITVELVNYMRVNQGGFFIVNDENAEEPVLELTACYAYGQKKYDQKQISIGDGLIGQAYLEKQSIYMTQVPKYYTTITSGLGESTPSSILIVPLKINEQVEGVVELASFRNFQPHEIEFVEKLSESIAATIASVKTSEKTKKLLVQSQKQAQRVQLQEEEMRKKNQALQNSQDKLTQQKVKIEKILEKSKLQESSLITLINNTVDFIVTIDQEYKIKIFNDAFKLYYTLNSEQRESAEVGVSILNIYPEDNRDVFQHDLDRALKGETFQAQRKLMNRSGLNIFDIYYSPIFSQDKAVTGAAIYVKDVTEYVSKNEEIRRSQQEAAQQTQQLRHIKAVVNRNKIGVLELDIDGYILDANEAFLKIMKYERLEDIVGENHRIFLPYNEINSKTYKNFWNTLRNGESTGGEYECVNHSGDTVWLQGAYNVITEVSGKASMVILACFEITETKDLVYQNNHQQQQIRTLETENQKRIDTLSTQNVKQAFILNSLTEGVVQFDKNGIIELCNKAAEKIFGIPQNKVLGQSIEDFFPIDIVLSESLPKIYVKVHNQEIDLLEEKNITIETQYKGAEMLSLLLKDSHQDMLIYTLFIKKLPR